MEFDGDNPRWICDWEPAAVWGEKKKLFDPGVEFKNRKLKTDYHGGRADWIEIYSNGTQVVRLRDSEGLVIEVTAPGSTLSFPDLLLPDEGLAL